MKPLPPIERSLRVPHSPAEAFQRFTRDFAQWWPAHTHSVGGPRVRQVIFESQPGGRIYEVMPTAAVSNGAPSPPGSRPSASS